MKIKVILWDIDGTILNFIEAEKAAIRMCFSQFQLGECTDEMIKRYSAINKRHWERLEMGEISKQEVLEGRFREFFCQEGISLTEKMKNDKVEQSEDEWIRVFNVEYQKRLGDTICFNDDSYELIRQLKGRVKQFAVTNGTRMAQERKLEKSGLNQLFDGVFISENVGVEKPNIDFFNYVFRQIGDYRKDEVMIVGDSLTSDMKGGNNAGIVCCWYHPQTAREGVLGQATVNPEFTNRESMSRESMSRELMSRESMSRESMSRELMSRESMSRKFENRDSADWKNLKTQPNGLRIDYEIQNLWQVEEIAELL